VFILKIKNILSNAKSKGIKAITSVSAAVTSLMIAGMIEFNASEVDFSGGVEKVSKDVIKQGKAIATTVFTAIAIVALVFTVAKGIKAAFEYRRGENVHLGGVIAGGIGTIVAGLASASTFFGWFGL
jgi:hypothetical protein